MVQVWTIQWIVWWPGGCCLEIVYVGASYVAVCCVYVPVPDELCGAGLGSEWCGCVLALLPLCMLLL